MGRRTNVMIEVEDDVFVNIVEPHKRNKTFSKLISSLLNGYISDGYIRAFVDDNLEEVRRAVVGSFEDSVGEMESMLANMGLFTDELGAHAHAGYSRFQQRKVQQAEELNRGTKDFVRGNAQKESPSRVDNLEEKVNSIERNMNEGFNRILEVLGQMSVPPMQVSSKEESPKVEVRINDIVNNKTLGIPEFRPDVPKYESPVVPATGWQDDDEEDNYDDVAEDAGVEGSVANNFLTSLISDFGMGF